MPAPTNSSPRISSFVFIPAILAMTLLAYLPSLANNFFSLDDPVYIKAITHWTAREVIGLFLRGMEGYHPLTLLTLSANYHYAGLSPFSFHLVNLLLHLANTALVFLLARRLTASAGLAGITAVIFGLHPVHVEAVAWVASRKDAQYAFFYLLALLSYASFLRGRQWRFYFLALALSLLAILSKGMAVALPLSLVLVDYADRRPLGEKRPWMEKIPFLALSLFFGVINVLLQQARGYIPPVDGMASLAARLLAASYALGMYLFNFFVPLRLCAYHPYPAMGAREIFLGAAAVAVLAMALISAWRRSRLAAFGLLFFLANIVLVLQVVPVSTFIIADRYNYVSSIGLCLLVGLGVRRAAGRSRTTTGLSAILFMVLLALLGWSTFARCQVWKDTFHIWNDVLRIYPRAVLALQERGYEYYLAGEYGAAERDFTLALEQAPYRPELYLLRGVTRSRMDNPEAALSDLNLAVTMEPRNIKARISRGLVLFKQHDPDGALDDFTRAIELGGKKSALPFSHRAMVKNTRHDPEGARQDATVAIGLDPTMSGAYVNRAMALEQLSRKNAALQDWRRALALDPACTQAVEAVARLTTKPAE